MNASENSGFGRWIIYNKENRHTHPHPRKSQDCLLSPAPGVTFSQSMACWKSTPAQLIPVALWCSSSCSVVWLNYGSASCCFTQWRQGWCPLLAALGFVALVTFVLCLACFHGCLSVSVLRSEITFLGNKNISVILCTFPFISPLELISMLLVLFVFD